jgi:hypothetical protein
MRLLLSQPAAYSLACGLVAATAGTAASLLGAGMTRLALWAAVTAGLAIAAGLGYRLPQPRAAPGLHRAHGQQDEHCPYVCGETPSPVPMKTGA